MLMPQLVRAIEFVPSISIPGVATAGEKITITGSTFGEYIVGLYSTSLSVGAILSTIVLLVAGFIWLTAAGNVGQIETAKDVAGGAVSGLALLLLSWVLLNTINPNLVNFKTLDIESIVERPLFDSQTTYCCLCGETNPTCSDRVTPSKGECRCTDTSLSKLYVSESECAALGVGCQYIAQTEAVQRQNALSICQKENPSKTCRLHTSSATCSNVAECQADLISSGRSGPCTLENSCASTYACNKAWDCSTATPKLIGPDEMGWAGIRGCCRPAGRDGDACGDDGLIDTANDDCASGYHCVAPDTHYGPAFEVGVCRPNT